MASRLIVVALMLLAGGGAACEPDEVQNSANEAVIRAQFFSSEQNQVPVSGVRMIVENPGEEADRPYIGPDVVAVSGEDGVAVARIFPGFNETEGGSGDPSQGPASPLDLPSPVFFADVSVTILYQTDVIGFVTGLTVGSGRLYDLGPVYLDQIGISAGRSPR